MDRLRALALTCLLIAATGSLLIQTTSATAEGDGLHAAGKDVLQTVTSGETDTVVSDAERTGRQALGYKDTYEKGYQKSYSYDDDDDDKDYGYGYEKDDKDYGYGYDDDEDDYEGGYYKGSYGSYGTKKYYPSSYKKSYKYGYERKGYGAKTYYKTSTYGEDSSDYSTGHKLMGYKGRGYDHDDDGYRYGHDNKKYGKYYKGYKGGYAAKKTTKVYYPSSYGKGYKYGYGGKGYGAKTHYNKKGNYYGKHSYNKYSG